MSGFNSLPPDDVRPGSAPDEPLALTVHGLPSLAQPVLARRQLHGRRKMLVLMLVCAAPVLASYFTYYVIRPESRKNYGQLIVPPRPLPLSQVQRLDGLPISLKALQGQWLLLSVSSGQCDAACQSRIYWTRQLREVMGRDKDRIERVWLVFDDAPIEAKLLPQVHAPLQDAQAFRVPRPVLEQWLPAEQGQRMEDHVYVVDPYGNLMLRWPAQFDAGKAKRDVHNLLRASGAWDQAGRTVAAPAARSGGAAPAFAPQTGRLGEGRP